MSTLELKDIRKSYGNLEVIHGVSLDIAEGEFVVFVGPSGCGKSTMLRMIAGLETITDGELVIDGKVMNQETPSARGIAMVFQSYALYPNMTVYQNMAFGLQQAKLSKDEIRKRVMEAAATLKIEPLLKRRPGELSGGQSQRVAIGRSIVRNPSIFLFDEPLSNLDAELRVHMRAEMGRLHKRIGRTTVYVTHDQVEAMTLADRIVVFSDGVIEQVGTPLDLYNKPANQFVAGFLGSPTMNFISAKIRLNKGRKVAETGSGQLPLTDNFDVVEGTQVVVGIRPEHFVLTDTENADIFVNIEYSEQLGGQTFLYCAHNNTEPTDSEQITVLVQGQHILDENETVGLTVQAEKIYYFDADTGESFSQH
ncbi:MAG: ABC transporter ATP-binding protein [Pseudomonadales bacterium]